MECLCSVVSGRWVWYVSGFGGERAGPQRCGVWRCYAEMGGGQGGLACGSLCVVGGSLAVGFGVLLLKTAAADLVLNRFRRAIAEWVRSGCQLSDTSGGGESPARWDGRRGVVRASHRVWVAEGVGGAAGV